MSYRRGMSRARVALSASLVAAMALVSLSAAPAAANHDDKELEVIVALNAAGGDRISVRDATFDSTSYLSLTNDVAGALDRPPGSFRASEDVGGGAIVPDAKLTGPDGRGGLGYGVDTGKLQVLAQREGYDAVIFVVCSPKVRQLVDSLVAAEDAPYGSPGSRCRGWYQPVDEPTIRAVVHLFPDRQRYPSAVLHVVGSAAVAFGLLGLGATLLRRRPLRYRSLASWLLAAAAVVVVGPAGWGIAALVIWLSGAAADPMLLGGGTISEQVVRTVLPGLVFVVPALLPGVILLGAAAKPKPPPPPPGPTGDALPLWWPAQWWQQWAAQAGANAASAPERPVDQRGWGPQGSARLSSVVSADDKGGDVGQGTARLAG